MWIKIPKVPYEHLNDIQLVGDLRQFTLINLLEIFHKQHMSICAWKWIMIRALSLLLLAREKILQSMKVYTVCFNCSKIEHILDACISTKRKRIFHPGPLGKSTTPQWCRTQLKHPWQLKGSWIATCFLLRLTSPVPYPTLGVRYDTRKDLINVGSTRQLSSTKWLCDSCGHGW